MAKGRQRAAARKGKDDISRALASYAGTVRARGALRAGCEIIVRKAKKKDKAKLEVVRNFKMCVPGSSIGRGPGGCWVDRVGYVGARGEHGMGDANKF